MSGDKIDIFGKSYFNSSNSGALSYSIPVLDILSGLLGSPGSPAATKGCTATDLNGQSGTSTQISNFLNDDHLTISNYINALPHNFYS